MRGVVESVKTEGGIVIKNVIPPDRARALSKYVLNSELNERKDTQNLKESVRGKGHRINLLLYYQNWLFIYLMIE